MTRTCKKVLKSMRTLTGNSNAEMAWYVNDHLICLADDDYNKHSFDCSKYDKEMYAIISKLYEENCLCEGRTPYYFYLTYNGLHPYEIKWEKAKDFILRSILVPILVASATAWLTTTFLT